MPRPWDPGRIGEPEHRGHDVPGSMPSRVGRALQELVRPQPAARYDLGVLFVHGMGEQTRGDTLTEAGDALVSWLERWCERPPHGTLLDEGDVRVLTSSLRTPGDDELTTAHLTLRLTLPLRVDDPSGPGKKIVHWMVAESWWAETFRPASFNQLLGWVLGIGPWVLATQFHGLRDRIQMPAGSPELLRLLLWPAALLTIGVLVTVALLVSLLLTLVASLVLLLRLLPIGPVQNLAEGIQRSLASSFGDLMILVQSPTRFAAMRSQVSGDLQALFRSCEQVVVIAHSQGTHIAWEAIRRAGPGDRIPSNLVRFFTYGQAMRKLKLAYEVSKLELDGRVGLVAGAAIGAQAGLALLLAAGLSAMIDGGVLVAGVVGWITDWLGVDGWFVLVPPIALIAAGNAVLLKRGRIEMDEVDEQLAQRVGAATGEVEGFRWIDLWASADPAPNGPLSSRPINRVETWRIRNTGSILFDHSIYWQNITEFVGTIARELGRLGAAGTHHFPGENEPFPSRRLRLAALTRGARVQVLTALRVIWLGAVLAFGATVFPGLQASIDLDWLPDDIPVISVLGDWLPALIALVVIAAAGLIGWVIVAKVWGAGVRADDRAYFVGTIQGPFPWPAWGALLLLAVLPILAALGLWRTGEPSLAITYAVTVPLVVLAASTFVSGGGRGFADLANAERLQLTALPLFLAMVTVAAILVAIFLGWITPHEGESRVVVVVAAYVVLMLPLGWATLHRWRRFLRDHRSLRRESA